MINCHTWPLSMINTTDFTSSSSVVGKRRSVATNEPLRLWHQLLAVLYMFLVACSSHLKGSSTDLLGMRLILSSSSLEKVYKIVSSMEGFL